MKWKNDDHHAQSAKLISGGLIAISLIILQDFIQLGLANLSASIAIFSFAITIPCLVGVLYSHHNESKYPYMKHAKFVNIMYAFGIISGFIGVTSTFWYMSWIAGVIFLGVTAGVFVLSFAHYRQLAEDKEGLKKTS